MPAIVIVGAQWGDEGKGKATDLLGGQVDYVVKPNGGNNAGHTVVVGGEKYELKLLPAGILSPNAIPIIGNGCVVNLEALFEEIEGLQARGADTSKLRVSANAHLVAPYHQTMDKVTERFLGKRAIGTTGRGIGPAYMDKIGRLGIRVQDVFDESILRQKVEGSLLQKNQLLVKVYNRRGVEVDEIVEYFLSFAERLRPMVIDATLELNNALDAGKVVLMEGGQATFLDVDHGTYPFVTSSNPTAGGASVGSGIGPTRITRSVGIIKAYTTRVGAGPFPTELFDEMGMYLQKTGGEFGVNTGRPRRCGWYDAVLARHASRVNGFTDYFVTKLDVLTNIEKIPVCVAYEVDGVRHDEMPMTQTDFHHAKPIFEYFDGWTEDISTARTMEDLPENARNYVLALEGHERDPFLRHRCWTGSRADHRPPRSDQRLTVEPPREGVAREWMKTMNEQLLTSLRHALAASPGDSALRLHVAEMLHAAGRNPEALAEVNTVIQAEPSNVAALGLLGKIVSGLSAPAAPVAAEPVAAPVAVPPAAPEAVAAAPAPDRAPADDGFDWDKASRELGEQLPAPFAVGMDAEESGIAPIEPEAPAITLADVGGLESVKARLNESFLAPMRHSEIAKAFGKSLRGGLLLYGPPGCGKTFLARAVAGELGARFMSVVMTDVLSSYMGQTEKNLKAVFDSARAETPTVLFLDEVDALGMRRGSLTGSASWLRQMVNQLLLEMDSMAGDNDGLYILAATNHPWDLDEALLRPGRLDRTVLVTPPDAAARTAAWMSSCSPARATPSLHLAGF